MINATYRVYKLPKGGRRELVAVFVEKVDAVNFAHAQSVGKYQFNHSMVITEFGKKVFRYKNGESV